jgi:hypothetical protein
MRSVRHSFLLAIVSVGIAASANAAPLTISNILGGWENATGGTPAIVNVAAQGTDTARWGVPANVDQSGYDFTPTAGAFNPTLGVAFSLGNFIHHNNPVGDDGSVPTGIDYSFSFSTNGAPAGLADIIHFDHNETPNAEPCPSPSAIPCDDIVTISSVSLDSLITVGSDVYFFNLLGFSTDGGATISSQFFSQEGGQNSAGLYAIVTAQPIAMPEPGSLLLIGTGLAGVVTRLRRRKK